MIPVGAEHHCNRLVQENTAQCKDYAKDRAKQERLCENAAARATLSFSGGDGKESCRANADEKTRAVDKAEHGQREIEGYQPVRADAVCDKEGIREDIQGNPEHAQHIQGDVFEKRLVDALVQDVRLFHFFLPAGRMRDASRRDFSVLPGSARRDGVRMPKNNRPSRIRRPNNTKKFVHFM